VRINLRRRGREYHIDAAAIQLLAVLLQRARVARQIVGAIELHRVNENRHHDNIAALARLVYQR